MQFPPNRNAFEDFFMRIPPNQNSEPAQALRFKPKGERFLRERGGGAKCIFQRDAKTPPTPPCMNISWVITISMLITRPFGLAYERGKRRKSQNGVTFSFFDNGLVSQSPLSNHLLQRTPSVDGKFGPPVPTQRNPVLHYAHEIPMILIDILYIVGSQEVICRNMKYVEENTY